MQDLGVIHQAGTGIFHLLPLGERSLQKLINIVDDEMRKINAQKLLLPLLTPGELWKVTGMTKHEQVLTLFPNQKNFLFTGHISTFETASCPQHHTSCTPALLSSYNINQLNYCPWCSAITLNDPVSVVTYHDFTYAVHQAYSLAASHTPYWRGSKVHMNYLQPLCIFLHNM
jgi:hypothetical protein